MVKAPFFDALSNFATFCSVKGKILEAVMDRTHVELVQIIPIIFRCAEDAQRIDLRKALRRNTASDRLPRFYDFY
jgi:hypothetical protein